MQNAIVITGRLTGPRSVELDEPVADLQAEVEVILRPVHTTGGDGQHLVEFLRGLAPGTRTREEIDRRLHQERAVWESEA
jgi:hypothetical protein